MKTEVVDEDAGDQHYTLIGLVLAPAFRGPILPPKFSRNN